jgi:hypothetical protein
MKRWTLLSAPPALARAAWVKLGGWPFHLWSRAGRGLSLASQAWLYATLVPNLGAYLLYRVTPLLAVAGLLRTPLLWLGASCALIAIWGEGERRGAVALKSCTAAVAP